MSVRNGLEKAKEILEDPKVKKAWEKGNTWDRHQREVALEAIGRALEHYKSEALRMKKYSKASP